MALQFHDVKRIVLIDVLLKMIPQSCCFIMSIYEKSRFERVAVRELFDRLNQRGIVLSWRIQIICYNVYGQVCLRTSGFQGEGETRARIACKV